MSGGTADSHGPMYGITSMKAVHRPNSSAYSSAPSTRPVTPRMYIPTPALVPMTVERIAWPLRYPHSALSIRCVSGAPPCGGKRASIVRSSRCMSRSM